MNLIRDLFEIVSHFFMQEGVKEVSILALIILAGVAVISIITLIVKKILRAYIAKKQREERIRMYAMMSKEFNRTGKRGW